MAEGPNRPPEWVPVLLKPGPASLVEGRCPGEVVGPGELPRQASGGLHDDGARLVFLVNPGTLEPMHLANAPCSSIVEFVTPVSSRSLMSNSSCHVDVPKHDTPSAATIASTITIDTEAGGSAEGSARPEGRCSLEPPRELSRDKSQRTTTTVARSRQNDPLRIRPPDIDKRKKERNRKAQRDFRERQKNKISFLEEKVTSLQEDVDILQMRSAKLRRENQIIQSLMCRLDHAVYIYSAGR